VTLDESDVIALANFLVNFEILELTKKILAANEQHVVDAKRQEQLLTEIKTLLEVKQ